jgi:hypothetical protein
MTHEASLSYRAYLGACAALYATEWTLMVAGLFGIWNVYRAIVGTVVAKATARRLAIERLGEFLLTVPTLYAPYNSYKLALGNFLATTEHHIKRTVGIATSFSQLDNWPDSVEYMPRPVTLRNGRRDIQVPERPPGR